MAPAGMTLTGGRQAGSRLQGGISVVDVVVFLVAGAQAL